MVINPGRGVGLRNVGSYQISGHPYITGSLIANGAEVAVDFPFVTREFTVTCSGSFGAEGPHLRVHFNSASSGPVMEGRHYVTLVKPSGSLGESHTFHTKCVGVYITCHSGGGGLSGFQVVANLTNIPARTMYALTGSGLTD
jgi:hypothetical protein